MEKEKIKNTKAKDSGKSIKEEINAALRLAENLTDESIANAINEINGDITESLAALDETLPLSNKLKESIGKLTKVVGEIPDVRSGVTGDVEGEPASEVSVRLETASSALDNLIKEVGDAHTKIMRDTGALKDLLEEALTGFSSAKGRLDFFVKKN